MTCRVLAQALDFQPVGEQQVQVPAASDRVVEVTAAFTTLRASDCGRRQSARSHELELVRA